jgi:hypothetical protein
MARTKQPARQWNGGKPPSLPLAEKASRKTPRKAPRKAPVKAGRKNRKVSQTSKSVVFWIKLILTRYYSQMDSRCQEAAKAHRPPYQANSL